MARRGHLHDDRLFECYLAFQCGEALDPSAADHLSDCDACGTRYAELATFLETTRQEAAVESDEIFTADRLRHQHDQIIRRLSHGHHPARVIDFPGRVTQKIARTSWSIGPRWLAASAAAGLFVGVAVGGLVLTTPAVPPMQTTTHATPVPVVRAAAPAVKPADDDAFLIDLEFALQRPNSRELEPFDALTPHVREIGSRIR
jgi:hypothetical protein